MLRLVTATNKTAARKKKSSARVCVKSRLVVLIRSDASSLASFSRIFLLAPESRQRSRSRKGINVPRGADLAALRDPMSKRSRILFGGMPLSLLSQHQRHSTSNDEENQL